MPAWSPILIQKIEIHALGFVLRRLQLNRHRVAEVAPHAHTFHQLILYLTGEGWQTIHGRRHGVRPGDLFRIPAGTPHGFAPHGGSRPVCLVLDFELTAATRVRRRHRRLSQRTLNELHALLARVPTKGRLRFAHFPTILALVARLIEPPDADDGTAPDPATLPPPLAERVRTQLAQPARTLTAVARAVGYHRDHLNRRLQRETGLGLRAHHDRLRLETAQSALRSAATVADAAEQAGFPDPNYFARWFKRHTGQTPRAWRADAPRLRRLTSAPARRDA